MIFQKKIYEGKAKIIFSGPKENTLIQYFKDDVTAFNAKKFKVLEGKGEINNLISEYLMQILSNNQIPNHFIKKISNREELFKINKISLKVNKVLKKKFKEISISLIDFKLEFGRKTSDDSLLVADEISPDSCRLCDLINIEKFDKDIFRYDKGNLVEAYKKLLIRLGIKK